MFSVLAGPAVQERLRVAALFVERAQPPPHQRVHHQTDEARWAGYLNKILLGFYRI